MRVRNASSFNSPISNPHPFLSPPRQKKVDVELVLSSRSPLSHILLSQQVLPAVSAVGHAFNVHIVPSISRPDVRHQGLGTYIIHILMLNSIIISHENQQFYSSLTIPGLRLR